MRSRRARERERETALTAVAEKNTREKKKKFPRVRSQCSVFYIHTYIVLLSRTDRGNRTGFLSRSRANKPKRMKEKSLRSLVKKKKKVRQIYNTYMCQ